MNMMKSAPLYAVVYFCLMVPTYILPYLGSNSVIAGAMNAGAGWGPSFLWWTHLWCLLSLVLMTWVRSEFAGKNFIVIFPILATAFDLTPGLSAVPLVPTVMHLFALILGVINQEKSNDQLAIGKGHRSKIALLAFGAISIAAVIGSLSNLAKQKKWASSVFGSPAHVAVTTVTQPPIQRQHSPGHTMGRWISEVREDGTHRELLFDENVLTIKSLSSSGSGQVEEALKLSSAPSLDKAPGSSFGISTPSFKLFSIEKELEDALESCKKDENNPDLDMRCQPSFRENNLSKWRRVAVELKSEPYEVLWKTGPEGAENCDVWYVYNKKILVELSGHYECGSLNVTSFSR